MIQITESSGWLAQHSVLIGILGCVMISLAGLIAITTIFQSYNYDRDPSPRAKRKLKLYAYATVVLFLIAMSLFVLRLSISESRYSGSAEYTVKQSEIQTSGQQVITINDGKSDVKLNVDDDDKATYTKGDKVEVSIQSDDKSNHGKHYLSNVLRGQLNKNILFKTEYTLKKPNVDLHKAINELFD